MIDGLHLSARHREALEALLRSHLPGVEVWAYGSRANGAAHDGSDLDLVLRGSGLREIPAGRLADFADAVRESSIPFLVEARDWARLPERFHREIEQGYVVLMGAETKEKNGWLGKNLGDCIEIANSNLSSSEKWSFVNYLDTGNITDNRISEIQRLVVGQDKIPSRARRKAGCGDIVYSTVRPNQRHYGLLRDIPRNFLVSTGFAVLRGRSGIAHTDFIYWFLTQDRVVDRLQTIAEHNTSAYPAIRPEDLELLPIDLPPLSEQQAIAAVLCALDDKIALNRRINETLEAMARALFKSWFVDFDPVRAKMEGRHTALPPEFANPFPGALVDSGTGEIPEGWKNGTLHDIASLNPESWSSKRHPDKIIYVDLTNTKWGNIENLDTFSWDDSPHRARRVLRRCDTIIATVRPGNGSFALIDEEGLTGSTGFAVLRPDEVADRELVWCAGTSAANIARLAHIADGGAYPAVRSGAVLATPVVLADIATREAFSMLAGPLLDKIEANRRESRALAALRDSLLPKLVSGELRVNVDDRSPGETVR